MQIGAQIMLRIHPGSTDSPGLNNLPKVTELKRYRSREKTVTIFH